MTEDKTLSSEEVFQTPYFKITKDRYVRHDGVERDYFVMKKDKSVHIVAISKDFKIYFVKQYRYPTRRWSLEIPAGSTDGEDSLKAAKRELWEETGLKGERWMFMGDFQVAPGLSTNISNIWMAKGLKMTENHRQDEEGIIECVALSIDEIREKIQNGEISDGPSLSVFGKIFWALDKCIHEEVK